MTADATFQHLTIACDNFCTQPAHDASLRRMSTSSSRELRPRRGGSGIDGARNWRGAELLEPDFERNSSRIATRSFAAFGRDTISARMDNNEVNDTADGIGDEANRTNRPSHSRNRDTDTNAAASTSSRYATLATNQYLLHPSAGVRPRTRSIRIGHQPSSDGTGLRGSSIRIGYRHTASMAAATTTTSNSSMRTRSSNRGGRLEPVEVGAFGEPEIITIDSDSESNQREGRSSSDRVAVEGGLARGTNNGTEARRVRFDLGAWSRVRSPTEEEQRAQHVNVLTFDSSESEMEEGRSGPDEAATGGANNNENRTARMLSASTATARRFAARRAERHRHRARMLENREESDEIIRNHRSANSSRGGGASAGSGTSIGAGGSRAAFNRLRFHIGEHESMAQRREQLVRSRRQLRRLRHAARNASAMERGSFAPLNTFNSDVELFPGIGRVATPSNLREFLLRGVRPPPPRRNVSRLPTRRYNAAAEAHRLLARKCVVCLDEYKDGDVLLRLPCFHEMHNDCIVGYLRSHNGGKCPVCRHPVTQVEHPEQSQGDAPQAPQETERPQTPTRDRESEREPERERDDDDDADDADELQQNQGQAERAHLLERVDGTVMQFVLR